MSAAEVNGKRVGSWPDAPDTGVCPDCRGEVQKWRLRRTDGRVTTFHPHRRRQGRGRPRPVFRVIHDNAAKAMGFADVNSEKIIAGKKYTRITSPAA